MINCEIEFSTNNKLTCSLSVFLSKSRLGEVTNYTHHLLHSSKFLQKIFLTSPSQQSMPAAGDNSTYPGNKKSRLSLIFSCFTVAAQEHVGYKYALFV